MRSTGYNQSHLGCRLIFVIILQFQQRVCSKRTFYLSKLTAETAVCCFSKKENFK